MHFGILEASKFQCSNPQSLKNGPFPSKMSDLENKEKRWPFSKSGSSVSGRPEDECSKHSKILKQRWTPWKLSKQGQPPQAAKRWTRNSLNHLPSYYTYRFLAENSSSCSQSWWSRKENSRRKKNAFFKLIVKTMLAAELHNNLLTLLEIVVLICLKK